MNDINPNRAGASQDGAQDVFDRLRPRAAYGRKRRPPSSNPDDRRPTIRLIAGETERAVDEFEALLIASHRGLYQRGGLIVAIGATKMPTWDGKTVSTQIIEERGKFALLEDAEAVARFERFNKRADKDVPCPPPEALVLTLKERKSRLRLPVLAGVSNCPSICADGRLLDQPGYDKATGILYDPGGVAFPRVPDFPTRAVAEAALKRILRLIETFRFVSDDDRAVALSLIFTAVARRGLPFAPLHGLDAPVAGSGKSKIVDIACVLATGHEAGVIAQGETREETEKRLSTLLMRGDPIIAIDNCELALEGALLNQALTQHWVELRILGFSKSITAQTTSVFAATGNNLIVKGDLTRRSVIGRLDPQCERPELLKFDYDPIADARENRGEIVAAILTILRAWHIAGQPNRPDPLQNFVQWSDTVRGALVWLGVGDPVWTMDRLRETDPALAELRAVLTVWRDKFGDAPTTVSAAIAAASERHPVIPDGPWRFVNQALWDALYEAAGRHGAIDNRILGKWLGKHAGRIINISDDGQGPVFVALAKGSLSDGLQQWRVVDRKAKSGLSG
jgi:putative DNA primase/helicase